jgi:hypothetical protein
MLFFFVSLAADMMKRVDFLLKTYQKPDDFSKAPKGKVEPSHVSRREDRALSFSALTLLAPRNIQACILSVECIDSHCKRLDGATDKSTLSTLHAEIGTRFFK